MRYPNVRPIQDGTPANAAITNRPLTDLRDRDDFLKAQLSNISYLASRLFLLNRPCDDACVIDRVVYLRSDGKWMLAQAGVDPLSNNTDTTLTDASRAYGIIQNITGSPGNYFGDIYFFGEFPVTAGIVDGIQSLYQQYYLSATTAGKITAVPPTAARIAIGKFTSATQFFLSPQYNLVADQHVHYWFTIDKTKFVIQGVQWLYPANEFPVYPPLPFESAIFVVNGALKTYTTDFTITEDGLLYNTDPAGIITAQLYYIQLMGNSQTEVTQALPGTDNIKIRDCLTGDDATTGRLKFSVFPTYDEIAGQAGSLVVKNLATAATTGHIEVYRGPIVEKVKAGAGITLDNEQGTVTVSTRLVSDGTKEVTDIVLVNAKEKILTNGTLSYIEFPKNVPAAVYIKLLYPNLPPTDLSFFIYYFGSVADINPVKLECRYKIIANGGSVYTPTTLFTKEITVGAVYGKDTLLTLVKALLSAECIVSMEIRRAIPDNYPGNFGVVFLKYS